MILREDILTASQSAGFDLCGVTTAHPLPLNATALGEWLAEGCEAGMEYLHRNMDKREDVRTMVDGARSVVVCGVSYKSDINTLYTPHQQGKIASYACNRDYHKSIKKMLLGMFSALMKRYPSLEGRAFTDSAPLFEKQYAVDAGLGWIGRQSLLVTPRYGSYVLLGELVLNDDVDCYDAPLQGVGCGACRRCVEACPNGAIRDNRTIDARRCISCQTIEQAHDGVTSLGGWIFGCDECQMCCPYNAKALHHSNPSFNPLFDPNRITKEEWLTMSDEEFVCRFGATPLSRCGLARLKDNLRGGVVTEEA